MGKRGPRKGEGGRPPLKIDMEVAMRAAAIGCTENEMAALIGMSRSGFQLRRTKDPELQEAFEQARDKGCVTLRRMQWQRAQAGSDTMLIWLGKNMLGQTDRREFSGPDSGPIEVIVTGVRRAMDIEGEADDVTPDHDQEPTVATGVQRAIEAGDGDD